MSLFQRKRPITNRPKVLRDGAAAYSIPRKIGRTEEILRGIDFICKRRLFGSVYSQLLPGYFMSMPPDSGVMIGPFIPSVHFSPSLKYPGDIDLLIIPYEGNDLLIGMAMAIELKVTRASFENPGKSPNQFGFSQASALFDHGFPFVSVVHLIISDCSPEHHWKDVLAARLLDDAGNCSEPFRTKIDPLPYQLVDRGMGRLENNRTNLNIGIAAAYLRGEGVPNAVGSKANPNPQPCEQIIESIGDFYDRRYRGFLDTPRY